MALNSLNKLSWLRTLLVKSHYHYYTKVWGMDIHPTANFSLSVKFDRTFPKGMHIGAYTYVAFEAAILTHDRTRRMYSHTRIGQNCFIGARSIILPGVVIGNNCVIGTGSVVTKDVRDNCIVAGNPAKIIRENIRVGQYGQFLPEDERQKLTPVEIPNDSE